VASQQPGFRWRRKRIAASSWERVTSCRRRHVPLTGARNDELLVVVSGTPTLRHPTASTSNRATASSSRAARRRPRLSTAGRADATAAVGFALPRAAVQVGQQQADGALGRARTPAMVLDDAVGYWDGEAAE
jgi:hypothetical protein